MIGVKKLVGSLLFDKIKLYGYIVKLYLKKRKRTVELLNQEWDRTWKKYENTVIDQTLVTSNFLRMNEPAIIAVNGKMIKTITKNFNSELTNQFINFMLDNVSKDEPVIEFGSGVGAKLFALAKNGFTNLHGFELTETGVKIAQDYTNKKGYDIKFDQLDLTKKLPCNEIENKIIFTYYAFDQLKNYMKEILTEIIRCKPKKIINFEVNYDDEPFIVKFYVNSSGYQNNFVKYLKQFEKEKIIKILSIKKLKIQQSPVNRISCIVWKPV